MGRSWRDYFTARVVADLPIRSDDLITVMQNGDVKKTAILTLLAEAGVTAPVTLVGTATISTAHGLVYVAPPEGETVVYHLPVYNSVGDHKRYKLKNIGQGLAQVDAIDGKTIDEQLTLNLAPGDRAEVAKDSVNWQTF